MILLILAGLLTAVLGVHPEGSETEEGEVRVFSIFTSRRLHLSASQLYEAVFEELPFFKPKHTTVTASTEKAELSSSDFPAQQAKAAKLGETNTQSLNRIKRNPFLESTLESAGRDSSPFLMSTGSSPAPTPMSTLNRPNQLFRPANVGSERNSTLGTLGRPEPPPYTGTLRK